MRRCCERVVELDVRDVFEGHRRQVVPRAVAEAEMPGVDYQSDVASAAPRPPHHLHRVPDRRNRPERAELPAIPTPASANMPAQRSIVLSAAAVSGVVKHDKYPRGTHRPGRAGQLFGHRYLTFRDCPREEITRWQETLRWLVQKLTYKYRRTLVLKSPAHTGRIRLLLETFPDARFVHIHRNPYEVFVSTRHTARKVMPWWTLQRPVLHDVEERALLQYEEVFEAFFAERSLVPPGRWHELGYDALNADPLGEMHKLYTALGLSDFSAAEPAVQRYLDSIRGYEKNRFDEIEPPWKAEVARRCRRCFEEWGYSV